MKISIFLTTVVDASTASFRKPGSLCLPVSLSLSLVCVCVCVCVCLAHSHLSPTVLPVLDVFFLCRSENHSNVLALAHGRHFNAFALRQYDIQKGERVSFLYSACMRACVFCLFIDYLFARARVYVCAGVCVARARVCLCASVLRVRACVCFCVYVSLSLSLSLCVCVCARARARALCSLQVRSR